MSDETAGAWSDMTEDEASVIQNARLKHDTGKHEALARLADKQQKRIATLEAQNALLRALYERHKHLDMFLSDEKFPPIGRTGSAILYELWEFIKQAAIDGGAMEEVDERETGGERP